MRRPKSNHIVLLEVNNKSFHRRLRGYNEVYLYQGDFRKAKKLPHDFIDAVEYYVSQHKAKEISDWLCSQYVNSAEVEVLKGITKDERSHVIVKKEILIETGKIVLSFILVEKFIEKYRIKGTIDFIPKDFSYEIYQIIRQKQGLLSDRIHIPSWYLQKMKRQDFIKGLVFRSAIRFYPLLISLLMWGKRIKEKESYKWGLHIWNTYANSICQYFVNTLVKENRIVREDLLYVVDSKISEGNLKKVKSDGFNCCSFIEMAKNFNFWRYVKEILPPAITRQKRVLSCTNKKALLTRVYFRTLRSYIFWEMFYKKYHVDDFITIQDPGEVARALLQKSHGSKNTFIYLSSYHFVIEVANSYSQAIIYCSCIPRDRFISSKTAISLFKENNGNLISNYIDTGILLSSIVFRVRQDKTLKERIRRELGIPEDKIIISYFDTPAGRLRWFNDAEGAQVIADILKLLKSHKEYFLVYKPKKDYRKFPADSLMQKGVRELIRSERTLYIDITKQKYQAQHIIGASDLIISGFGSSAGFEAVTGGVKNVFYAANERYNSDTFMINKLPRFCAYGYKRLEEYTDYWLNQCGESVFRDFQEQYIKKHIDSYCDGRALDRLEDILKEKETIDNKGNCLKEQALKV